VSLCLMNVYNESATHNHSSRLLQVRCESRALYQALTAGSTLNDMLSFNFPLFSNAKAIPMAMFSLVFLFKFPGLRTISTVLGFCEVSLQENNSTAGRNIPHIYTLHFFIISWGKMK